MYIYNIEDIELACYTLLSCLIEMYHSFSSIRKIQSSNSKNKLSWIDIKKDIIKDIKQKLYNKFISNSCQENKYAYKLQRNTCTTLIRESEIKYNSILLNNSKNKWSRLNKLLIDDTCKSDNLFFVMPILKFLINLTNISMRLDLIYLK